jgi:hypothetical protein
MGFALSLEFMFQNPAQRALELVGCRCGLILRVPVEDCSCPVSCSDIQPTSDGANG